MPKRKQIGLALGGGAARGCAHIGVIRALEEAGYEITAVAGTSIGAFVGGVYAGGGLDKLEEEFRGMSRGKILSLWDFRLPVSGLIEGKKIEKYLEQFLSVKSIGKLPMPFAAVAANLKTGDEVVLDKGKIIPAVRASISLPAIFTPVEIGRKHLVDGGLVNPLPVNVLRDMGLKNVVAVDLNYHLDDPSFVQPSLLKQATQWMRSGDPLMFDVIYRSVMMIQRELTIQRLKTEPAELVIRPKVGTFKAFDFHRAAELIEEGYRSAKLALGG